MLAVGGCAHKLAKPDAASPQGQTPATNGDVSSDERHFQEMMDLLRKLKAEESKPVAPVPASSSAPARASPSAAPQAAPPAAKTPPAAAGQDK